MCFPSLRNQSSACCLMPENVFMYFIHSYDSLWRDGYFSISYIVISRSVILKPIQFGEGMCFSKEKILFSFRHFFPHSSSQRLFIACLLFAVGTGHKRGIRDSFFPQGVYLVD